MPGLEQPARGKWFICYQSSIICLSPASRSSKARASPRAPLELLVSLLRSPKMQEGIAPPRVVTLPVLQTGFMSNFCSFLLPQGLPSPRFGNCHPAASHSAAHLLKNRYGGMSQSCSRKWMGAVTVSCRSQGSYDGGSEGWTVVWVWVLVFHVCREVEAQFTEHVHPPQHPQSLQGCRVPYVLAVL